MTDENMTDELSELKALADEMGVSYSPNIGLEKLSERIKAAEENPKKAVEEKETTAQKRTRLRKEASALIRVRVTCMNPNKREWQGEIFTVSNAVVGTFRNFVPFNIDEGWHLPQIVYQQVKERRCQIFKTVNGPNGEKLRKGYLIPEFSIDVLPPLTPKELNDLAKRQAMAGGIED